MRRGFMVAALSVLTACWDENVVLDACVDAGRCSPRPPDPDAGLDGGDDAGSNDSGVADAGVADAGSSDGGEVDAGPLDAGAVDAGPDAGVIDAGTTDAGARDAGATDAGVTDAGVTDAGMTDAGVTDAGTLDAGAPDAGVADAGRPDAGVTDAGIDAGVIDSGVADAGRPDAGIDAGVIDSGVVDAGLPDAGPVDAGPPLPRNGATCISNGQCASNRCMSNRCVVWSANTTGAVQYFGAMGADPMGGLLLGAFTTDAFDAGVVAITSVGANSFWLRHDGVSGSGGLLGTQQTVVDVAFSGLTPAVLCAVPTGSTVVTLGAPGSFNTYPNFVGVTVAPLQGSGVLYVGGTNLATSTITLTPAFILNASNSTTAREFTSSESVTNGLNAAVTRLLASSDSSMVVGGWYGATAFDLDGLHSLTRLGANHDAFVAGYAIGGALGWWVHFSAGGNLVEVKSLVAVPSGYLVVLRTIGILSVGDPATPLLPAMGTEHVVLVSLGVGGTVNWARAIGNAPGTTTSAGVAVNVAGEVVLAGETPAAGALTFEDGGVVAASTGTAGTSAWVAVLNQSGALVTSRRFSCAPATVGTPTLKFGGVGFDTVSGGVLVGGESTCLFDLGDGARGVDNQTHIFWGNLGRWW